MAANGLLPSSEDWMRAACAWQEFSALRPPPLKKVCQFKKENLNWKKWSFREIHLIGIPYHLLNIYIFCLGKIKDHFDNVSVYFAIIVMKLIKFS